MKKRRSATSTFTLGSRTIELFRDRIRIVGPGGKIVGIWTTSGAILHGLCTVRAGTLAIPTHGRRLYRVVENEDRPAMVMLPSKPARIWVNRGRILVAGRHDLTLLGVRPMAVTLRVVTEGKIHTGRSVVSYPVAAIAAHRETHVINLSSSRGIRLKAGSAIGRLAVHRRIVIILEREDMSLVDGNSLKRLRKIHTAQRLVPGTLRVAGGLGAAATRDTVVIADLVKHRLKQVQLSGIVKSVRIVGKTVRVVTSMAEYRLGPDGKPVRD